MKLIIILAFLTSPVISILSSGQNQDSIQVINVLLPTAEKMISAQNLSSADSILTEALALSPRSANSLALRGFVRLQLGEMDAAITDLDASLELAPKNHEARANRAIAAWHTGAFLACEADALQATRLAPDFALGHYALGLARFSTGRYDVADYAFSRSIELDPNYALAWFNRGICKIYLHDYAAACADWQSASSHGHEVPAKLISEYCTPKTTEKP